MAELAAPIVTLIDEFSKLPGIGRKSAERLAYYILRVSAEEAMGLSDAIRSVKFNVHHCSNCFNLCEEQLCPICQNPGRNPFQICVVEQPQDLIALEQTGAYTGVYHVLMGRISPLDKTGPENLTINALVQRVKQLCSSISPSGSGTGPRSGPAAEHVVPEIILATNPTVEGDGTAAFITNLLSSEEVRITRLARGITIGSTLEFTNKEVLSDAINERKQVE